MNRDIRLVTSNFLLLVSMIGCILTGCESPPVAKPKPEPEENETVRLFGHALHACGIVAGQQQAKNWCWSASITTIATCLLGFHINLEQEAVVRDLFGGGMLDSGAYLDEIVRAIDGKVVVYRFPYGNGHIKYRFSASLIHSLSPTLIRMAARNKFGIIYTTQTHAMVLGPVEIARNSEHERIVSMEVWDPWPGRGLRTIAFEESQSGPDEFFGGVLISVVEE